MDVNTRIDHMDEELKLVKNEIKQVLLEIQEHVLNIQNPFSTVVVGNRTADFQESGQPAAPVAPAAAPEVAAPPAPGPVAQVPQIPEQQNQGFNPQLQGGFPGQQGQSGAYGQQGFGGPQYPPPGFDAQPAAPQDAQPAAPQDSMEETQRSDWSEQERRSETIGDRKFNFGEELLGDYDLGDIGDLGSEDKADWAEEDEGIAFSGGDQDDQDEDDYQDEDEDDVEEDDDYESDEEKAVPKRGKKAKKLDDDEPEDEDATANLDLVTLASLVQWTDRVVQKAGPEYLEALFEISEMTGRLSSDLKNTLLVLVKLLSIEVNGRSIGATETVRLLAQLDGLMGNTTKEDARLLPFILDGNNLEVLSLIQR